MVILDFVVKCYFVFLEKRGEDGLYASFIPATFVITWIVTFGIIFLFSFLNADSFEFIRGLIMAILSYITIFFLLIRKFNSIYIVNGRLVNFNKLRWVYYLSAIPIFFLGIVLMVLILVVLARYSSTVVVPVG